MMKNLAEWVESSLRAPSANVWLPELTTELVEAGWQDLYRSSGLSPDTYGTARAIARDPSGPRRVVAHLPVFSGGGYPAREFHVETLDAVFARGYEQTGVKFYSPQQLVAVNAFGQLKDAINTLKPIPSLLTTVAALVRTIHVIDPGGDDYDISFSEPHIPFSIFVSVPRGSDVTNPLRVAEAIVHEAMHLQLTLIERATPLVVESDSKYLSPWQQELRAAGGIVHALYVFKVIDALLRELLACESLVGRGMEYVFDRRDQISKQVGEIKSFQENSDLTPLGAAFVGRLLN